MTVDVSKALDELQGKLGEKFKSYEAQLAETGSVSASLRADLKAMAADNEKLTKEMAGLTDQITTLAQKGVQMHAPDTPKSLGEQFVSSDSFKSYKSGNSNKARVEFQANTIIGEGGSPQNPTDTIVPKQNVAGIIGGAFRPLRILDTVPSGVATGNTVHYTRELLFTNNAAERAEGVAKPESVITFEAVDAPVRTIAHFIKVSKQVLDDAPALKTYIDTRMSYGVRIRAEQQIVNGNGTSPNLSGILDTGNFTSLTATSGDNDFDFANRVKYKVIESDYMPDHFMVNPADWGRMERIKTGLSGDKRYVGADGAVGYLQNGLVPTLWGLPVVVSNSIPAGKIVGMASDAVMFWERQGVTVEIFDQNQDDVEKNLLTIRAEMRGAFTSFRPAAIVAGTLPNA